MDTVLTAAVASMSLGTDPNVNQGEMLMLIWLSTHMHDM